MSDRRIFSKRAATEAKKCGIAFGSQSERFKNVGVHPSLDKRVYTHRYPNLSPGCYNFERQQKPKGIGYAISLATEEHSRTLLHLADQKLKRNLWQKTINGPGWHDVDIKQNLPLGTFANSCRFPISKSSVTPGPGSYIKPCLTEGKAKVEPCSFTDTPTFEFDNTVSGSFVQSQSHHLPPNLYKVKSYFEEFLSKRTSKRGPYDLFTGARDESSLYGYLAVRAKISGCSKVNYEDVTQRLNNPCNCYKGKFLKCGRECYPTTRLVHTKPIFSKPDPKKPGPNTYHIRQPSKPINVKKYPFNSSIMYVRPRERIKIQPPPGRYNPKRNRNILGGGMKSGFKSKTQRGIPLPEKYSWFE